MCEGDACGFLCLQEIAGVIPEVARRTGAGGKYNREQWEENMVNQRAGLWGGLRSLPVPLVRRPQELLRQGACVQKAGALWQWYTLLFLPP